MRAEDAGDAGVIQRGERLGLAPEAGEPIGIGGECLRQDLEGDVAVEARVAGFIDLAHAPFAKLGDHFEGPEACSWRERHEWEMSECRDYTAAPAWRRFDPPTDAQTGRLTHARRDQPVRATRGRP
jgi:hypothetical protein